MEISSRFLAARVAQCSAALPIVQSCDWEQASIVAAARRPPSKMHIQDDLGGRFARAPVRGYEPLVAR